MEVGEWGWGRGQIGGLENCRQCDRLESRGEEEVPAAVVRQVTNELPSLPEATGSHRGAVGSDGQFSCPLSLQVFHEAPEPLQCNHLTPRWLCLCFTHTHR